MGLASGKERSKSGCLAEILTGDSKILPLTKRIKKWKKNENKKNILRPMEVLECTTKKFYDKKGIVTLLHLRKNDESIKLFINRQSNSSALRISEVEIIDAIESRFFLKNEIFNMKRQTKSKKVRLING